MAIGAGVMHGDSAIPWSDLYSGVCQQLVKRCHFHPGEFPLQVVVAVGACGDDLLDPGVRELRVQALEVLSMPLGQADAFQSYNFV